MKRRTKKTIGYPPTRGDHDRLCGAGRSGIRIRFYAIAELGSADLLCSCWIWLVCARHVGHQMDVSPWTRRKRRPIRLNITRL